ncbi:hypothetical protein BJ912DRAFT_947725 [Pholiota molesta]|nr:hypothetical protein BJ912DRAFT_947725 [Pholiota molesta]
MMDFDIDPSYSRWQYATSDSRSEPIPPPRPAPRIAPPSLPAPSPPPTPGPPPPVNIGKGVWLDDGQIIYSKDWPPVQEYLNEVREAKTMLPAPSDVIFTLAALSVLQHPEDVAHWIFWAQGTYWTVGELVDSIALQKCRLILSPIPWNGHREYKAIVNARQEKFTCVVVQRKWYPTDCTGADAHKRTLRSSADQTEPTANDYFGIIENEGSSRRRAAKSAARRHILPSPNKRTRRLVPSQPKAQGSISPEPVIPPNDEDVIASVHPDSDLRERTPPVSRTSTRVRRKVTPSARSPRIISAVVPKSPSEETISPASTLPLPTIPSSATHSRNRSSSAQSSESTETIAVAVRSPSVASVETAVAPSLPKKRKLADMEPEDDNNDDLVKDIEASAAEGMVTRNRASKIRSGDSDKSQASSRMSTPAAEPAAKVTRPRARAKRARV